MKPYKYLLLPILAFLLITSCSKEDVADGPVSLNPNVAGISLTRAGASNSTDLSAIGLYAVNQNNTQKTYGIWPAGTYGKYSHTGNGVFTPAEDAQTIWLNTEKAVIYTCHPAPTTASSITDGNNNNLSVPIPCIPVPAGTINLIPSISGNNGPTFDFTTPEKDYMYGVKYDENKADDYKFTTDYPVADNGRATGSVGNTVSIGLKHVFSQIKLVIKKGDYPTDPIISKVTYTRQMQILAAPDNTQYNVKMQLTDGKLTGLADATEQTYQYDLSGLSDGGYKLTNDEMTIVNYILPNNAAPSKISIMVDGKDMSITYNGDPDWKPGMIYTYTVSINGTGLKF